jgi:hypothetical protein
MKLYNFYGQKKKIIIKEEEKGEILLPCMYEDIISTQAFFISNGVRNVT